MRASNQPWRLTWLAVPSVLIGCSAPSPVERWTLPDGTDADAQKPTPDAGTDATSDATPEPMAEPAPAPASASAEAPPDAAPEASGPEVAAPVPEPTAGRSCALARVDLQPGELLLLLDRSGSMDQPLTVGGRTVAPNKWNEVALALDAVIAGTQDRIAWGLKLFPAPVGNLCGVPDGVTVPLALRNHPPITAAIAASRARFGQGDTPTREAVRKALAFLKSDNRRNPHIVIATDGIPNCGAGSDVTSEPDDRAAAQVVSEARAAGVSSFVVGIATANTDAHSALNAMAEGSGHARAGATKYFPAGSRAELVAALDTIMGQIASCSFAVSPAPPAPENVVVELDGMPLPRDQNPGWSYGPTRDTIVLAGPPCDKVKATPTSTVRVLYGCPAAP